jgi:hypothetical protein
MTMTRKILNYGIYRGNCQVFDGTEPARYETLAQAQAALPRLQAIEDAMMPRWTGEHANLEIGGRSW